MTLPWLFVEEGEILATWLGFEVGLYNSIGYVAQSVGLETTQASEPYLYLLLGGLYRSVIGFRDWEGHGGPADNGSVQYWGWVAFLELGGIGGGEAVTTASQSSSTTALSTGDIISLVQPFLFDIGFWKIEKTLDRYLSEARRLIAAQLLVVFCASVCVLRMVGNRSVHPPFNLILGRNG